MANASSEPKGGGKLLSFVGLGFWQAWWMVAMCTDVLLPNPASTPFHLSLSALLLIASCLGYAVVVLLGRLDLKGHIGFGGVQALTGVLSVAGSVGMGVVAHTGLLTVGGGALFVIAVAAFSLGNALLLVSWGTLWSTLATGYVGRLLCVSYTAAFVLFFFVRALPLSAAIAASALLPLASLVGYRFAQRAPRRAPVHQHATWDAVPVAKALVALFVANAVWGMSQKVLTGTSASVDLAFAFGGLCLLAFTAYLFVAAPTDEPTALYRPILPALACGFALVFVLPPEDLFLGEGIMIFGGYCLDMFIMLVSSDVAFRARKPVVLVFGTALFVARAGSLLGTLAGEALANMQASTVGVAFACIACLVVAGTLLFSSSEPRPHVPRARGAFGRQPVRREVRSHRRRLRPDGTRAGSARPVGARTQRALHRRRTVHRSGHRQEPRQQHLPQGGRARPPEPPQHDRARIPPVAQTTRLSPRKCASISEAHFRGDNVPGPRRAWRVLNGRDEHGGARYRARRGLPCGRRCRNAHPQEHQAKKPLLTGYHDLSC